ncbi:MAG: hypothetical protein ACYCZD_11640 [Rhodanobacter sp.]
MNLGRTLLMPWMAVPNSTRWITAVVFALSFAGYSLLLGFSHAPHAWAAAGMALGLSTAFCWAFFMPNTLVLAFFARLVLPRLLAGGAILAAARAHSSQPSTGMTMR